MSTEKKRLSRVFNRIGHGKKRQEDSDDEFDAKVQSIAQEIENPEDNTEKASTISRMKNKLGSLRINSRKSIVDKADKRAEPHQVEANESIVATATIAKRSSSDTIQFPSPESANALEVTTDPPEDDGDGCGGPSVAPDLLKRRVSEVLEFESASTAEGETEGAMPSFRVVSKVGSKPAKNYHHTQHEVVARMTQEDHHTGGTNGSNRRINGAKQWIEKKVLHKPGAAHHQSDTTDEYMYGPPLEVEGDYCV